MTYNTGKYFNSKEAFEGLFKTYYNDLLMYSRRYIPDDAVIEDIIQDTFLTLWKNRNKLHTGGNIKSYLFKSVYNNCLNYLKHNSVKQSYIDSESVESDAYIAEDDIIKMFKYRRKSLIQKEVSDELKKAIDKLPEKRKRIFILSRKFGMKNKEIADYTQVSIKLVERQLSLAISSIREDLNTFLKEKSD